jgi:hypothetical protein
MTSHAVFPLPELASHTGLRPSEPTTRTGFRLSEPTSGATRRVNVADKLDRRTTPSAS